MPTEFFYTAWKDGGLGLPKLVERWSVLQIRTFLNMIQIPDATLREMIATCIADEARCRGMRLTTNDPLEVLHTPLPTDARGNTGTSNLLARFLYAQRDIGIKVLPYAKEGGSEDEMISQEGHTEEEETYDWSLQPIEQGEVTPTSDRDLVRKLTRMMREIPKGARIPPTLRTFLCPAQGLPCKQLLLSDWEYPSERQPREVCYPS